MIESGQKPQRPRLRLPLRPQPSRRSAATTIATVTVAAAVLGSVGVALASAHPTPTPTRSKISGARLGRVSRVPSGWAPVPYRDAQLSVPPLWLVQTGLKFCDPQSKGMIFVGTRPHLPAGTGCHLTTSIAWIRPAGHIPPGLTHRKPTAVINGLPVYRQRSAPGTILYLVPRLEVRVAARGPLAKRVLATLTRSPLAVVFMRGPASPVPTSWTRHRFGGVSFATPKSWHPQHKNQWATCGTGIWPGSLLLINATKRPAALPCPFPIPTAAAERAVPGLTVVTGKYAAQSVDDNFTICKRLNGARICLSSSTGHGGFGSTLEFSVSRPHHKPTLFVLGLSGSGTQARAIFDSIRTASH